jgi:tetratricopeptide (TPR) repeat protein
LLPEKASESLDVQNLPPAQETPKEQTTLEDKTDETQLLEPSIPEPLTKQKIEALLTRAESQFQEHKYTSPFRDNVVTTLRVILDRDTDNDAAKKMIERIRGIYMKKGEGALKRRDYLEAAINFKKALYVSPDYLLAMEKIRDINSLLRRDLEPGLPGSNNPVESMIGEMVDFLLVIAKEQVKKEQYTYPAGKNAFVTLQEVLRIDPDNREAKKLLESIRDAYMELGEKAFLKNDYLKARRHFTKAYYVFPGFSLARNKLEEINNVMLQTER